MTTVLGCILLTVVACAFFASGWFLLDERARHPDAWRYSAVQFLLGLLALVGAFLMLGSGNGSA